MSNEDCMAGLIARCSLLILMFGFSIKPSRYLSFTFDDGFIAGARKIDRLLSPHKATFYLVTGWIKPNHIPIGDEYNQGVDHGSLSDWFELSKKGHEIGSHSVSHIRASVSTREQLEREFRESLEFLQQIHAGPYSMAFPHNVPINISAPYDSIRLGTLGKIYNSLDHLDFSKLTSWSPWPKSLPLWRIFWRMNRLPPRSWLILNLHSLDGEGWQPWTSAEFAKLVRFVNRQGFQIKTIAEMTNLFKLESASTDPGIS